MDNIKVVQRVTKVAGQTTSTGFASLCTGTVATAASPVASTPPQLAAFFTGGHKMEHMQLLVQSPQLSHRQEGLRAPWLTA